MRGFVNIGALIAALVIAVSCSEDSATGPQGFTVISGHDTVTEADWSTTAINTILSVPNGQIVFREARYLDLMVPELDSALINNGAVLVWMRPHDYGLTYLPLPYSAYANGGPWSYYYRFEVSVGRVRVLFFMIDTTNPTANLSPFTILQGTRVFRWVVIPAGATSGA